MRNLIDFNLFEPPFKKEELPFQKKRKSIDDLSNNYQFKMLGVAMINLIKFILNYNIGFLFWEPGYNLSHYYQLLEIASRVSKKNKLGYLDYTNDLIASVRKYVENSMALYCLKNNSIWAFREYQHGLKAKSYSGYNVYKPQEDIVQLPFKCDYLYLENCLKFIKESVNEPN